MFKKSKKNNDIPSLDYKLQSLYYPKDKECLWISIHGEYGVNPANQKVANNLMQQIRNLSTKQGVY